MTTVNDNLTILIYEGHSVRNVTKDGEVWWVAKDVCDVFGETNRNRAMQSLDDDEKGYTQMSTPGGLQVLTIVNESGLYSLLFAMQPQKARGVSDEYIAQRTETLRRFRRWVTHEVLPAIRRTGSYTVQQANSRKDRELVMAQGYAICMQVIEEQRAEIAELAPDANYARDVLLSDGLLPITVIAKDYGMSGKGLNELLHEWGVQYRCGDSWVPYAKYQDKGYTQSKTHLVGDGTKSAVHTYWTQKGCRFLHELIKSKRGTALDISQGGTA
jgi:prophage antirepressor-like protein